MPEERCRLRLKRPDGSEFEAEGDSEFVDRQRDDFYGRAGAQPASTGLADSSQHSRRPAQEQPEPSRLAPNEPRIAWDAITELRGQVLTLRAKLPNPASEAEACLLLLACSQRILNNPKPTATQLAKWLRRSGYPISRMDRTLESAVRAGQLLASGSRRSRCYELTPAGRLKALLLAERLSGAVQGR